MLPADNLARSVGLVNKELPARSHAFILDLAAADRLAMSCCSVADNSTATLLNMLVLGSIQTSA